MIFDCFTARSEERAIAITSRGTQNTQRRRSARVRPRPPPLGASTPLEVLFVNPPPSRNSTCTYAEAHTGRRSDRSTPTVYETRRELNRCTRHRGKKQTEACIRGPPLLHRPKPNNTHPLRTDHKDQNSRPKPRSHSASTAATQAPLTKKQTNWVKLESAASYEPPRHQTPTSCRSNRRAPPHRRSGVASRGKHTLVSRRSDS